MEDPVDAMADPGTPIGCPRQKRVGRVIPGSVAEAAADFIAPAIEADVAGEVLESALNTADLRARRVITSIHPAGSEVEVEIGIRECDYRY
jgi:hypothetical protein